MAPGKHGANRTGRPFTGDFAGDLLYATLLKFGLATGTYRADPADDLRLTAR
jgi:uracil-DNA glycosylase